MPVISLTQSLLPKLRCEPGRSKTEWCDAVVPGLYIPVSDGGSPQTFFLRFKDANKKTCHQRLGSVATLTLAQARKAALAMKAEIALGRFPGAIAEAAAQELTYAAFFEQHYLPHVKLHKRTWRRDEQLFRVHTQAVFGHVRLTEINRKSVQAFHADLRSAGLSPASCDHHIKLIRHALNLAVEWDMLEQNPIARVTLFNADNKVERYLDEGQLQRLLAVLNSDENRPICLIALFLLSTGARMNEALQAKWEQIDQRNRVWRIPASNSKSGHLRSVPLNDSALDILAEIGSGCDFVFVNRKTGLPFVNIHKVWERLRLKAGLPHLRIHDLRHQYASFLVNSGRTLYEVQHILGHSDPTVTQRYAHLSTKALQEAANSASVIIKGASETGTSS